MHPSVVQIRNTLHGNRFQFLFYVKLTLAQLKVIMEELRCYNSTLRILKKDKVCRIILVKENEMQYNF